MSTRIFGIPVYPDPKLERGHFKVITNEELADQFVAHAHGCRLPPDHDGGCVTDTPHQFGPDGCEHCKDSTRLPGHSGSD